MTPDLDKWLPDPTVRVAHRRHSSAPADDLWQAAREVRLADTAVLGRLVRWRIPGVARGAAYDELFRQPPFMVLEKGEHMLVSGLVGRIWTPRRDYPRLSSPQEFRDWRQGGTARVVIANWAQAADDDGDGQGHGDGDGDGGSTLAAEARVEAIGAAGRVGVGAVRPLVLSFQHLIGSEAINAAVRRAEQRRRSNI
jgi:hypothetical protein